MTGQEIIDKFSNMIDDRLDQDFLLQLLNDAKDEVETERPWELIKHELEVTVPSGYSFTSALVALPARFLVPCRLTDGYSDYGKADFDDRPAKESSATRYFLDMAAGNLHLCGRSHAAKTLWLYYTASTAAVALATSWAFPEAFHRILPLKMAKLYYAVDAGEKARAWDDRWDAEYAAALASMERWDARLKLANRSRTRVSAGAKSI